MFSKITAFLKPQALQKEPNPSRGMTGKSSRKQEGRADDTVFADKEDAAPFSDEDIALISTEAIRRILEETADKKGLDKKLGILARLEQHGIKSIPVRQDQSVWSALDDAGDFI